MFLGMILLLGVTINAQECSFEVGTTYSCVACGPLGESSGSLCTSSRVNYCPSAENPSGSYWECCAADTCSIQAECTFEFSGSWNGNGQEWLLYFFLYYPVVVVFVFVLLYIVR